MPLPAGRKLKPVLSCLQNCAALHAAVRNTDPAPYTEGRLFTVAAEITSKYRNHGFRHSFIVGVEADLLEELLFQIIKLCVHHG